MADVVLGVGEQAALGDLLAVRRCWTGCSAASRRRRCRRC